MTLIGTNYPTLGNLFDDFLNTESGNWRRRNYSSTDTTLPKVNIKENDNGFVVEIAAPGMKKDDFNILLDKDILTISSEKNEETDDSSTYLRREFDYQSFQREFTLPDTADGDKIKGAYEHGILTITIPKKEEAQA
jgi:HSP20 family protein